MNVFLSLFFLTYLLLITQTRSTDYVMLKEIDGIIYVGGRNSLSSYKQNHEKLDLIATETYIWPLGIMNGSDIGFAFNLTKWPNKTSEYPNSMAFDTCLNWKQEHLNESVRYTSFDYQHFQYHTPSGNWETMDFICTNSFIKEVEVIDKDTLWVCGTFGAFPRAFSVNKINLKFIKFVDLNIMSCARYIDEPMATFRDTISNQLYIASGWGLYRPDKTFPDVPNNNSTMLYADWRLYRNLFTLPGSMAWVLSSDLNFIKVVKESDTHLYFFGYEINNQYGLNNQEDRQAWQSFLLRLCKKDLGFKYVPTEIGSILTKVTNMKYYVADIDGNDFQFSPTHEQMSFHEDWYHKTAHLPTKHFVNTFKINFGCYIGKRPRSISDNHFWGETNVVYMNKLADVIFDPNRRIKYRTKNNHEYFGCTDEPHSQLPLMGIFNKPGIQGTAIKPAGSLCQLQINENIFFEVGSKKAPYHFNNILDAKNAYEEIRLLSSINISNFYGRTLDRINRNTFEPYWNQGILFSQDKNKQYYKKLFQNVGECYNESFYNNMNVNTFLAIQSISNTAWPNELANKLSSIPSSICQYSSAELYSFNASFVVPGVEFKRIFVLHENYTNYHMHKFPNETELERMSRLKTSPLIIVNIITTNGILYRVVLCDFDSAMVNYGEDMTNNEWYNWCIFRHTDQPYLYRQYAPMERRDFGESYQYRASSLLKKTKIVNDNDSSHFPLNTDPQFHIIKDVLRKGKYLHVLTTNNIYHVSTEVDCKSYNICIECASDPMCMWNIHDGSCNMYNGNKFSPDYFIQDVLDRGFRCASVVQLNHLHINIKPFSNVILHCLNAGFWRGKIIWKMNGIKINKNINKNFFLLDHNTALAITEYNHNRYGANFTCHGVKDDHDKLFGGIEYKWSMTSSEIILNRFIIGSALIPTTKGNPWKIIAILFILITFLLIFAIIFQLKLKNQFQSSKIFHNSQSRSNKVEDIKNGLYSRTIHKKTEKSLTERNLRERNPGYVVEQDPGKMEKLELENFLMELKILKLENRITRLTGGDNH